MIVPRSYVHRIGAAMDEKYMIMNSCFFTSFLFLNLKPFLQNI